MFGDATSVGSSRCDVSVIIPAFNAQDFLAGAVQSVQGQTCSPREIIIVDDASPDRTVDVARDLAAKDARIRVHSLARNGGPSAARNAGVAAATRAWVTFLDADDGYDPHRLGVLSQIAHTSACDVITDNLELFGDVEAPSSMFPVDDEGARPLTFPEFLQGCHYGRRTKGRRSYAFLKPMIRRDFIAQNRLRYDEGLRVGEDLIFYVQCFLAGAQWMHTMRPLYRYCVRSGSLVEDWRPDTSAKIGSRLKASLSDKHLPGASKDAARKLAGLYGLVRRDEVYGSFRQAVMAGSGRRVGWALMRDPATSYLLVKELILRSPQIVGRLLARQTR